MHQQRNAKSFILLLGFLFFCVTPRFSAAVTFIPSEKPSPQVVEEEIRQKDLVVGGARRFEIKNKKLIVEGNIFFKDGAELFLDNAILEVRNYPFPKIVFSDRARFTARGSVIRVFGQTSVTGDAKVDFQNVVFVNALELEDRARASVANSWLFEDRFGGIHIKDGARAELKNTVVGGVAFDLTGHGGEVRGLFPGFFERWQSAEALGESSPWEISFENVEVKENSGHRGNYELGWSIAVDANASVSIADSTLNRLSIGFQDEEAVLDTFLIRKPKTWSRRGLSLDNVTVQGEWRFLTRGTNLSIADSDGIGLKPEGGGEISVKRSEVVEFVPANFRGRISFDNAKLTGPFWILGASDFIMDGSVKIEELDPRFSDKASLSRKLDLVLRKGFEAVAGVKGRVQWRGEFLSEGISDGNGILELEMLLDETRYREAWQVTVEGKDFFFEDSVSIFTSSPFVIDLGPKIDVENFSFGLGDRGFYIEAFIVNRGTEAGRDMDVTLESPGLKALSPKTLHYDELRINQEEPIQWALELPRKGKRAVTIRAEGQNFPTTAKDYFFERDEGAVYPVILAQEFFEEGKGEFTFWSCDEEQCAESDAIFRIEEKDGDLALRGENHGFALLNTIYGEDFFALDFLIERGSVNINFRSKPLGETAERYFATISPRSIALTKQDKGGFKVLRQEEISFLPSTWQTLGVSHKEGKIQVFLNEKQVLEYFGEKFLEEGIVSMEPFEGSLVWFDDVVLKGRKNLPSEEANPFVSQLMLFSIPLVIFFAAGFIGRIVVKKRKGIGYRV